MMPSVTPLRAHARPQGVPPRSSEEIVLLQSAASFIGVSWALVVQSSENGTVAGIDVNGNLRLLNENVQRTDGTENRPPTGYALLHGIPYDLRNVGASDSFISD